MFVLTKNLAAKFLLVGVVVAVTFLASHVTNVDAGTVKGYHVIHGGSVENLIRLDSDLVASWFSRDLTRTLVEITRADSGKIGDVYTAGNPIGSKFSTPVRATPAPTDYSQSAIENRINSGGYSTEDLAQYLKILGNF